MTVTTIEQLRVQLVEGDNRFSDIFSIFEQLPFETFEELKDSELLVMLQSVLTKEQVVLVEQLLSILPHIPYNESYNRRSYRAPQHMKLYGKRMIEFLVHLRDHPPYDFYEVFQAGVTLNYDYTNGRYQFVTQDDTPIISTMLFMYELAMKLNAKDARVEAFVREILWKNGAHPLYRRELIRGIMMSEHEEMHELLANVLLAAKNQEGVRQVITESIDEGSLKAQLAFMKVILEHDLLRFSSVVRAVDVWFGLGYEASDRRQLEYVLKTSYAALQDESLIEPLLASASNLDVFIALWCIGSRDINSVLTRVEDLLTRETHVQQTVLYTLQNLGATSNVTQLVYPHLLKTTNVVTFLYGFKLVVYNIHYLSRYSEKKPVELVDEFFTNHPWLAEHAAQWLRQVELFIGEFSGDTYTIEKTPFTFISMTFSKLDLYKLQLMLALYLKDDNYIAALATDVKKQPVDCRSYFYEFAPAWTENVELLLPALKDRSSNVRFEAIKQLQQIQYPLANMKSHITSLLMAKSGEMRMAVIGLLKVQPIAELEVLATELLQHKKEQVRLGVLELLLTLKGALTTTDWTSQVPNPTEKERTYLQQLQETKSDFLCEPMEPIHYVVEPKIDSFFTFKDFIHYDFEQLKEKLQPLRALIEEHAKFAYASPYSPSELVGNYLIKDAAKLDMPGSIDELPLAEVWVKWLIDSDLTVNDIYCYLYVRAISSSSYWYRHGLSGKAEKFFNNYVPEERQQIIFSLFDEAPYENQVLKIMHYVRANGDGPLQKRLCEHLQKREFDYVQFCSSMLRDFAHNDYESNLGVKYNNKPYTALDITFFNVAFMVMGNDARTPQQIVQYFDTAALFYEQVEEQFDKISTEGVIAAFSADILTETQMRQVICMDDFHEILTCNEQVTAYMKKYGCTEKLQPIIDDMIDFVIEAELARGDLQTATTKMVRYIPSVRGMDYFIRLLQALGDEKLSRQWMYSVETRKDSLSTLLEKVVLDPQETKEACFEKLNVAGFSEARLLEVMLYNSRLIPLISAYIGWDGLEEVAWYFIAHTSESTNDYETAKIMEYSAIPVADFQRGAFDRAWFIDARVRLTKSQFEKVYEAAKYAASGSNHRRAQLYARATVGELDGAQLKEEIREKRNKDKLRAYSLIPATVDEAKERYVFFQQFLKESRQFGAQRRASEAEAVEMAIFNLAQQVASGNTTQFMWQMEQARYNELEVFFTPLQIEDVELCLVQQEKKLDISIIKNGKALKSVPKKLAKHEDVLKVQEAKKELMEQYRRTRKQLEVAMCEEVVFDAQILYTLLDNPFLSELISALIWRQGEAFYAIKDKQFVTLDQREIHLVGDIQLAHPAHFYAAGNWRDWQRFVFAQGYKQPFKQVFREFYLPTADERDALYTNRFEGYQIQPNKAVALLKSRGWKTSYEEPLRKISYRYNVMTYLDFVYDHFTPADVEAPTLQDIYFVGRLTNEQVKLGEIAPVHFSEVMRDLDLVVSVAHAGEVDPEASHSTVEMRAVIAEEMIQLFQLTNASVKQPHIFIEGQLGNYSIHLGSGNVHQLGGAMIPVLAIPSQHRGRVFLPFVDEDPKTAEISAKLLLFAEDDKINDPNIRGRIR